MNIEVEIRSFITKDKYEELIKFFTENGKFEKEDYQESFYFDCPEDLRIQKNNFFSKVWLKSGNIHDDQREEIEIKFDKDDFEKMEQLFLTLGYKTEIKWFRNRHEFTWGDVSVCVDYTKGYGYILELEILTSEDDKDNALKTLNEKIKELNIEITPKEEFKKQFENYKENWKELTK